MQLEQSCTPKDLSPEIYMKSCGTDASQGYHFRLKHKELGELGEIVVKPSALRVASVKAHLARSKSQRLAEKRRALFNPLVRRLKPQMAAPQNALQKMRSLNVHPIPAGIEVCAFECPVCKNQLGVMVFDLQAKTPERLIATRHQLTALLSQRCLPIWLVGGGDSADLNREVLICMVRSRAEPVQTTPGMLIRMINAKQHRHCGR